MFRSSTRSECRDANAATWTSRQAATATEAATNVAVARLQPADQEREQHQRGERSDAEREVELGDVIQQPARDLGEVVALLAGDPVRAEEVERRAAAGELREQDEATGERGHRVEHAELAQPSPAEGDEQQRRRVKRGQERDRLRPREERDQGRGEEERDPTSRGPLEREHEREHGDQEHRVERVLGHQRAGVEHRRERHRQPRGEQREPGLEHPAREEVRRDRGERDHEPVDRLRGGVGVRHGVEQRVRRRDQERVDDAVRAAGRLVADEEAAALRDALRELRVDELVDHDPRGNDPAAEAVADERREDDDAREPRPDGDRGSPREGEFATAHGADATTHRCRPRGAGRRALLSRSRRPRAPRPLRPSRSP